MKRLRLLFLILAVGVFGLLGWRSRPSRPDSAVATPGPLAVLRGAMDPSRPGTGPASPAIVGAPEAGRPAEAADAPGADTPEFAPFWARLRADFPREAAAVEAGSARAGGPPGSDAAIWDALRDLEQTDGVLAAGADAAALDRFFDARAALLAGLAPVDAHRCADFLYGTTDAGLAAFTATHRPLVATLAGRTLDAIADGRSRHLDRTAPTTADLDALSAGLAALGVSPAEVGLLIDGTTPDPPPSDARLCEIGRTYLDVLHGLPPDARDRIYGLAAELLARS